MPQNETLAINSEDVGTEHEQIYYYASEPGQTVTFNRFWYPGWTAWLLDGKNGRPVEKLEVRRENGPLARVVVPIPQGEGYILLRFEDTPLRAGAKWITIGVVLALVRHRCGSWREGEGKEDGMISDNLWPGKVVRLTRSHQE